MEMKDVDVLQLEGKALDWAVAVACEMDVTIVAGYPVTPQSVFFDPSTNWSLCGPLIEKHEVTLYPPRHLVTKEKGWGAQIYKANDPKVVRGETPLIAACRAIVSNKLGHLIEVPTKLIEQQ